MVALPRRRGMFLGLGFKLPGPHKPSSLGFPSMISLFQSLKRQATWSPGRVLGVEVLGFRPFV